jgi:hypothetical protein
MILIFKAKDLTGNIYIYTYPPVKTKIGLEVSCKGQVRRNIFILGVDRYQFCFLKVSKLSNSGKASI